MARTCACGATISKRSKTGKCYSCAAKSRAGIQPIDGHYIVQWGGRRWYLNTKDGYYRNRDGELLHRHVYMAEHGVTLPPGHAVLVHHVNEVVTDFAPDNLEGCTPSEHLAKHG